VRSPEQILREAKTIAVVGASPKPDRPSHGVMRYLLEQGYRVIPVRPADCDEVLGIPCVPTLAELDEHVDLVDVFRRPEYTPEVAREAVAPRCGRALAAARDRLGGGTCDRRSQRARLRRGCLHLGRPP